MILVFVEDVDAAVASALARGGQLVDSSTDQPWGRSEWGAEQLGVLPG